MQISFIKIKKKSDADKSKRTRNSEATFVIKQSPKRANPMQKTMDFSIRFLFLMLQFLIVLGCATKPGFSTSFCKTVFSQLCPTN